MRAGMKGGSGGDLPGFGQAKSCILLFMYGSPSQLETFDPKPDAPVEIRGELGCIRLERAGPERLRAAAAAGAGDGQGHADPHRCRIRIRSTAWPSRRRGIPRIEIPMELNPRDPNHWPFIGSVVDYVDGRRHSAPAGQSSAVPRNLVLPWAFSSRRVGEVARAGPYGGFLGQAYDPICTEFVGEGTKKARKTLTDQTWEDLEPYRGITPESRFQLSGVSQLGREITLDRLDCRRSLLRADRAMPARVSTPRSARSGIDRHRAMAYDLLGSEKLRQAFDLEAESLAKPAQLYGMTLFGQAALPARRLVEAGGRFITVFWDEFGLAGTGWDTHWDHFPRMKDELLPGLDRDAFGPACSTSIAAGCSTRRWSCS